MNTSELNDIVIFDQAESCPYLPGKTARMPLRMPVGRVGPDEIDQRLAEGHRRTGEFVYQTKCPNCQACEPIRILCQRYEFSRNAKRTIKRGDEQLQQKFGSLVCDQQRVTLFNKHRRLRGLSKLDKDIDSEEYEWGFVRSCFQSFEISYWYDGELAAVAVCDRGASSLSAVYTFYDPDLSEYGIGTYSILKQIEYCQQEGLKHLYLGYYVADCNNMKYKARFVPQERMVQGRWQEFTSSSI